AGFCLTEQGELLLLNIIKHITGEGFGTASSPNPEDESIENSIDSDLSWKSGTYAFRHNVYFSTVFDDANDADLTNQLGVLLVEDHDVNNYDLDRLDYGQSYYWRVDEVNSAPDRTIFKGNTWSFTTEHFSYPIDGGRIEATASSSLPGQGPENTINRSGLEPSLNKPYSFVVTVPCKTVGVPIMSDSVKVSDVSIIKWLISPPLSPSLENV
ncbi:hypothetical protein ACFLZ8_05480, partial [Planctomycetota bacterium]